MDNTTITISKKNRDRLINKKYKLKKKSIDDVITELLNRDDQAVKV